MYTPGSGLIVEATRAVATSALPNAPVVDDDTPPTSARLRVSLATALRGVAARATRAAERVEPLHPLPGNCEQPARS